MRSGWTGCAQPNGDVGFPHAKIELPVGKYQIDGNFRIQLDKFPDARRQPVGAEADCRRHPEFAGRFLMRIHQLRLGHGELGENLMRRLE